MSSGRMQVASVPCSNLDQQGVTHVFPDDVDTVQPIVVCILEGYVDPLVLILLAATHLDDWDKGSPDVFGVTHK